MSLSILRGTEPTPAWEDLARERGLFYHHPLWVRLLAECFSYRLFCFTATRSGETVGALALMEIPWLLGPRRLVSLPFSYAAGPIGDSAATVDALIEAARFLMRERKAGRLEIKQRAPDRAPAPEFIRVEHYAAYLLPTEGGEAKVWERFHADSTRRGIRKAEKAGVVVTRAGAAADWESMALLEEATAHRHGVPAPPRSFFRGPCHALQREGLADLYLARLKDGSLAAGIVVWKGPREWIYAFGASRPDSLADRPNHLLLWTAVKDAIAAGVSFDLGRAAPEQTGLVEFKRRWGGQPVPLAYDYWPAPGGLNVAHRSHGPLALAAWLWSRLPARLTRTGSFLYRYLG